MTAETAPVLSPPREITEDSLEAFEQQLEPHVAKDGPGIVLDLAGVDFINSAGLGTLVKVGMRLDGHGRRLALARPTKTIERMLKLIGLDSKLPVFRTVDEASSFLGTNS